MEEPKLKCACSNCGEVIEYARADIGQPVECPKCHEKSQLPGPTLFDTADAPGYESERAKFCPVCRAPMMTHETECAICKSKRTRKLVIGGVSALVAIGILVVILNSSHKKANSDFVLPQPDGPLPQPMASGPKSINDLKVRTIALQQSKQLSNDKLVLAVGDVDNVSDYPHMGLKLDLDLLDAAGNKIGALSTYMKDLVPRGSWHFAEPVSDPRVKSVRFANIQEDQ